MEGERDRGRGRKREMERRVRERWKERGMEGERKENIQLYSQLTYSYPGHITQWL